MPVAADPAAGGPVHRPGDGRPAHRRERRGAPVRSRGMNRIRHAYREMVPGLEPYFVSELPRRRPRRPRALRPVGAAAAPSRDVVHGLTTTIGMVATIDAMIVGAIGAVGALGLGAGAEVALLSALVGFAAAFGVIVVLGTRIAIAPSTGLDVALPVAAAGPRLGSAVLADVGHREVDLPSIAGVAKAALPAALDRPAVSRDLADEALVEAGPGRAVPVLAGGTPDRPGGVVERHQEQALDAATVEVVHRLRLAVGRAADDRDGVGHLRRFARRPHDDELAEALDRRLHGSCIGGSSGSPSPCHSPISGSNLASSVSLCVTRRSGMGDSTRPAARPRPAAGRRDASAVADRRDRRSDGRRRQPARRRSARSAGAPGDADDRAEQRPADTARTGRRATWPTPMSAMNAAFAERTTSTRTAAARHQDARRDGHDPDPGASIDADGAPSRAPPRRSASAWRRSRSVERS